MERDAVLIFHSIHRVMRAEQVLKKAGHDVRLMPVPRELSSDCGLTLAFPMAHWESIRSELEGDGIPPQEVYLQTEGGYRRWGA